jgi:hypothetical protein
LGILFFVKLGIGFFSGITGEKMKNKKCEVAVYTWQSFTESRQHSATALHWAPSYQADACNKSRLGEEDLECCKVQEPTTHAVCGGLMILSGV